MPGKPKPQVTAENERKAWRLRAEGKTVHTIGESLGLDPSTVAKMLKRVEARLHKEFVAEVQEIKARQTVQLEYIAEEAMGGWDTSKQNAETERTVTKRIGTKPGEVSVKIGSSASGAGEGGDEVPGMYLDLENGEEVDAEDAAAMVAANAILSDRAASEGGLSVVMETTTREVKGQVGDSALLAQARGAHADIRKIWGIDAPAKSEISGANGGPVAFAFTDSLNRVYGDDDTSSSGANRAEETGEQ